jgi:hypothetical protein
MFGFLLSSRRFRDFIASLGCTLFERIRSDISKLSAMSSLLAPKVRRVVEQGSENGPPTRMMMSPSQPAHQAGKLKKTSPP